MVAFRLFFLMYLILDFFFFFGHATEFEGILVPRPGIEPQPTAVKAHSPNHCTTREPPDVVFRKILSLKIHAVGVVWCGIGLMAGC